MESCPSCDLGISCLLHRNPAPTRSPKQPRPVAVEYEDEYEKSNAALFLQWSSLMEEGDYKTSSFYKKVKVLLISWEEDSDDLKTKPEVDKLGDVFANTFKFKVVSALLAHRPSAQLAHIQVNYHVARFLKDEDGPNTLLIVYYAGHGAPGHFPGSLELTGKKTSNDPDGSNAVLWNHVEGALQHTRADVLEIFDCCYAGDLGGTPTHQSLGTRSFEFLGACSSQSTTRSPGQHSFTTALIWSLKVLAKTKDRFTISQLAATIRQAPQFPQDQVPVFFERGVTSIERIILAPLSNQTHTKESAPSGQDSLIESPGEGLLTLNFVFDTPPNDHHITKIAKALNKQIKVDKIPVNQIVWGGLHSHGETRPSARVQSRILQAIHSFKNGAARRKLSRAKESLESLPTPDSEGSSSSDLVIDQKRTASPSRSRRRSMAAADLDSTIFQSSTESQTPAYKKQRR